MDIEVLHIGIRESAGTRVLRLTGELDAYSSEHMIQIADTWIKGAKKIAIDLDDLLYIDSAGLSALVWMWIEARDQGTELTFYCNNQRIHRVLEITGLLKLFILEPSISKNMAISTSLQTNRSAAVVQKITGIPNNRARLST